MSKKVQKKKNPLAIDENLRKVKGTSNLYEPKKMNRWRGS